MQTLYGVRTVLCATACISIFAHVINPNTVVPIKTRRPFKKERKEKRQRPPSRDTIPRSIVPPTPQLAYIFKHAIKENQHLIVRRSAVPHSLSRTFRHILSHAERFQFCHILSAVIQNGSNFASSSATQNGSNFASFSATQNGSNFASSSATQNGSNFASSSAPHNGSTLSLKHTKPQKTVLIILTPSHWKQS